MKDLRYCELYELYKNLLTDLRREIVYDYYMCDLSLGEIAETYGVSRQGVNDCLKKTREQLDGFENSLGLYGKTRIIAETFERDVSERVIEIIKR